MGMKLLNREYELLVLAAKKTIGEIENYKLHIADLAIKACNIKLGGHLTGFYSVSNFADDVGINRKTLSCWIHNRKIQVELKKKKIKVTDEHELNKVRLVLRADTGNSHGRVNKYSDPRSVVKAYTKNKTVNPEDRDVANMIASLGTIKFRIGSYALSKLDQDNLINVHQLIMEINQTLSNHFEGKVRLKKGTSSPSTQIH